VVRVAVMTTPDVLAASMRARRLMPSTYTPRAGLVMTVGVCAVATVAAAQSSSATRALKVVLTAFAMLGGGG
jgi:hypothetical protein